MALKPLNSVGGFSVGEIPANVILANSDIFSNRITVNTFANLGGVANLYIGGGSEGQVLQTDGNGVLTWTSSANVNQIHNGNSNVTIPDVNGNVYINANAGTDRQWNFSTSGNTIFPSIGTANLGNLVIANYANFANDVVVQGNIANANNISITYNLEGNTANFSGNITSLNANLGNLITANYGNFANDLIVQGNIANANNIIVTNNANIGFDLNVNNNTYVQGTSTANFFYANYDANIAGNLIVQGNIANANNISITYNLEGNTANFSGNITTLNANLGNLVTANYANFVNGANVGGNLAISNSSPTNGILTDNLYYSNGSPWDLQEAAGANTQIQYNDGNNNFGASSAFTFDYAGNVLTVTGNAQFQNVDGGNLVKANNFSTNGSGGDVTLTSGNVTGANVVLANSFTSNGGVVDFSTNNANVQLGSNANVHIYGGNVGEVLQTDGAGNLNWYAVSATGIQNGTSNVTIPVADGNVNTSVNGNANVFVVTGTGANVNGTLDVSGNLTSGNANLGNLVTVNYGNFANDLVVQGNIANANNISVTNNITAGSANVTNDLDVGGNIVTGTGSGGNISGVNYITANVANITDVVNTGKIANGTSNIRIDQNGNITLSSNNLSNVFTFTYQGANVVGYIEANGLVTAGGFVGSNLVSNVGILSLQATQVGGDYNINLLAGGNGNIDVGSTYVTSLKNPVNPDDAATKEYVDNISQGLFIHAPANVTTTSNLTASYLNGGTVLSVTTISGGNTITFSTNHGLVVNDDIEFTNSFNGIIAGEGYFVYSVPALNQITIKDGYFGVEVDTLTNGTGLTQPALGNGGVGATLTNSGAQAALTIDNVLMTVGARVLVQGQTNQFENGIYDVTTVGTVSTNWVLTRSSDGDSYQPKSTVALCSGSFFFIMDGDTYAGSSYVLTAPPGEILIGTSNIVFSQFSAAGQYTGSNGISIVGTLVTANVDNDTTAIIGGNIAVKVGANLTTPNIGAATGISLDLSGNVLAGNLNSNATITTVDLNATGNILAANLTSNAFITAVDGNLTGNLTVGGNITTTGATGNISGANVIFANSFTSNGGVVDFSTNNANVQLGSNANVHLYGGSTGQILQTDGNGNLTWSSTPNISIIQNGTSNVTIPTANGNVTTNVNGNTVITVTDTGANVTGYANISGNVTGANLVTGGNVYTENIVNITANTSIGMGNGSGIVAIYSAGNATQFAPSGQITLGGASQIVGGTFGGSGITLGGSQTDLFQNRGGNVTVQVGTGGSIANTWDFNNDGNTSFPAAGTVNLGNTANISNNIVLGNTAVNWGTVTTVSIAANQTIAQIPVSGITGIEFLIKGIDSLGAKYSVATVQAVTDGANVDYSIYGGVYLTASTGVLAVNITGGNLALQVTPSSTNSTVWTTQFRTI
jgi:hypothetical protein